MTKHPRHKPKKTVNWPAVLMGALVLILIAWILFKSPSQSTEPVSNPGHYGEVDVQFYVMSQCPYGTQVEDTFAPVMEELGDNINFQLYFIANDDGNGTFESLHGAPEVTGDLMQVCVQEHYPEALLPFIVCQNKKVSDMEGTIDSCAEKAGIDAKVITDCYKGAEGKELLSKSAAASVAAQAMGSPTIYIGGQLYQSGRETADFKRAICAGLDGHPACEGLPACSSDIDCKEEQGKIGICEKPGKKDAVCKYEDDAEVKLTIVNSNDCGANCDVTEFESVLHQVFMNLEVDMVEATTPEGKALIAKYDLEKAPSFIFDKGVVDSYQYKNNPQLPPAFNEIDGSYVLMDEASGATYILDEQKRKEIEDKVGVTKGDNRPQIDFYVMSYCPYGNMAEEAIEPVYQLLKGNADFNPHYVYYSNYAGGGPDYCLDGDDQYCSMHGAQEARENLREQCVDKYMGTSKMFKYILAMNAKCTAQNADNCWEGVAKGMGLDTAKIDSCEKQEGLAFAKLDKDLNAILGVQGSPTVFIDGEPYNGARTSAGYAAALCAAFDNAPTECDDLSSLGSATATPTDAAGCGV